MDEKPQRARSTAEITAAAKRCAALCKWKPNAAALELLAAGLMAVGWSSEDATAAKAEALRLLTKEE